MRTAITKRDLAEMRSALAAVTELFGDRWRATWSSAVEWEILGPKHPHPNVRTVIATTEQSAEVAWFIAQAPRWLSLLLAEETDMPQPRIRRSKPDRVNRRDVAILGGDPSL